MTNLLFMAAAGAVMVALSAVWALIGADLSVPLLVVSFVWGVFAARIAIVRYGSAVAIWRRLRQPPA